MVISNLKKDEYSFNKEKPEFEYFTASFSTETRNKNLWENYAIGGKGEKKGGLSIEFDESILTKGMKNDNSVEIGSIDVVYDENLFIEKYKDIEFRFKNFLKFFRDDYPFLYENPQLWKKNTVNLMNEFSANNIFKDLFSIISSFKSIDFKEEKEFRLYVVNSNMFKNNSHDISDKIQVDGCVFLKFPKNAITKIYMGENCKLSKEQVQNLFGEGWDIPPIENI